MRKLIATGLICCLFMGMGWVTPIFALDKGTFSVKNETSYVNPATGKTEDGGTQIALGDGMCRTTLGKLSLLETDDWLGRKHLTIRMGLTQYTSKQKFFLKNTKGGYDEVKAKMVLHDKKNNTKDFRFKVESDTPEIKVSMYVDPMGREVIFFAKTVEEDAVKGDKEFKKQVVAKKMTIAPKK